MDVKQGNKSLSQTLSLIIAPLLSLGIVLFTDLEPGKPEITYTLAIAVLMAIWWVTEAIPLGITALLPVVLFPGDAMQVNDKADGILFLSLISGRNADMLIGKQVVTAPILKQSSVEVLPTGYMLIDSGRPTTVSYMSNTTPIPHEKNAVAACTAMAGEMLGLKLIFMDGGSGALNPISEKMIATVSQSVDIPLIIGGGISSGEKAIANCKAGADIIVVGNAIEKDENLIFEIANAVHNC